MTDSLADLIKRQQAKTTEAKPVPAVPKDEASEMAAIAKDKAGKAAKAGAVLLGKATVFGTRKTLEASREAKKKLDAVTPEQWASLRQTAKKISRPVAPIVVLALLAWGGFAGWHAWQKHHPAAAKITQTAVVTPKAVPQISPPPIQTPSEIQLDENELAQIKAQGWSPTTGWKKVPIDYEAEYETWQKQLLLAEARAKGASNAELQAITDAPLQAPNFPTVPTTPPATPPSPPVVDNQVQCSKLVCNAPPKAVRPPPERTRSVSATAGNSVPTVQPQGVNAKYPHTSKIDPNGVNARYDHQATKPIDPQEQKNLQALDKFFHKLNQENAHGSQPQHQ